MRIALVVLLSLLSAFQLLAQDCVIKGKIIDEHGHELPGASVVIMNSTTGVNSGSSGDFVLKTPCLNQYRLQFSFLGFESKDTVINSHEAHLIIVLKSKSQHLHEFVISEKIDNNQSSLSTETLSSEELLVNDQGTLAKNLEQIPGIQTINVGVGIAKPVLRGMSMNRLSVVGNGVKQEGQQWGADHGLEMDQFDAENVEIIKGSSTLKYGSGSASGIVNVLPFSIPTKDTLSGAIRSVYKSNNNHWGVSGVARFRKNAWFSRVRLTAQEFGDYRVPADSFIYNRYELPLYDQQLKNTAGNEYNGSAELGYQGTNFTTRLTASSYNLKAGIFPKAKGRYIASGHNTDFLEMAKVLLPKYGDKFPLPKKALPKWLVMIFGPLTNKMLTRKFIRNNINVPWNADNSKIKKELGIKFKSLKETMEDSFDALIKEGVLKVK